MLVAGHAHKLVVDDLEAELRGWSRSQLSPVDVASGTLRAAPSAPTPLAPLPQSLPAELWWHRVLRPAWCLCDEGGADRISTFPSWFSWDHPARFAWHRQEPSVL